MNKFRIARAGIDVNEGIDRMRGNTAAFEELLSKFPQDTHYTELLEAVERQDVSGAFAAAHALKGIAGNMSMTKLYESICAIVEILRGGSLEVEEYLPQLKENYDKVVDAINDMNKNKG